MSDAFRTSQVGIRFFLGDEWYATRLWDHVPRVGDSVLLNERRPKAHEARKKEARKKMVCVVTKVVWGVDDPERSEHGCQTVNIQVERGTTHEQE